MIRNNRLGLGCGRKVGRLVAINGPCRNRAKQAVVVALPAVIRATCGIQNINTVPVINEHQLQLCVMSKLAFIKITFFFSTKVYNQFHLSSFMRFYNFVDAVFDESTANGADPQDSSFLASPLSNKKVGQEQSY